MVLKGGQKVVGNCVCVTCGLMFADSTRPISAEDDSTSGVAPSPRGGEGTTAPIHPAGSGPGLPLSTQKRIDYVCCLILAAFANISLIVNIDLIYSDLFYAIQTTEAQRIKRLNVINSKMEI